MGDVFDERSAILTEIAGRTLCDQLRDTASAYPDAPAYSDRVDGGWHTITYSEARARILEIAAGLVALGLRPGDAVALMMVNRSEHVLADLGAVHAGGVGTTIYSTFTPDQVSFVADNSKARIAILGGTNELHRWQPILAELPALQKIVILDSDACPAEDDRFMTWADFVDLGRARLASDPGSVDERWQDVRAEDPLTILYTSGTTGHPKGVVLTHTNVLYEVAATDRMTTLPSQGTQISYLTYAHIAERVLSLYLPLFKISHVHFCPDVNELSAVLGEVHPVMFFGVPRVWEKMMGRLLAVLSTQPEEQQANVRQAMAAGLAFMEASEYGKKPNEEQTAAYEAADAALLSIIRSMIGLDKAGWLATAAAPMPIEVQRFFAGLGMKVLDVYGMTETTGAFTANGPAKFKLGTVGPAVPGIEVRVAADGEILCRGPITTAGYLNRPEATAELIDDEGWLHTGDVGSIDDEGFVTIVDRKKELIITAGGENVSPANIESLLKEHELIGQALAFGDRRPYPVAILTLDGEVAPVWAQARGIAFADLAELAQHPDVLAQVSAAVDAANAKLARVQQVKKWTLLPVEWTAETEELTPTLKLKRRVIHAKYAEILESLYTD